jgi:sulfiredoxin
MQPNRSHFFVSSNQTNKLNARSSVVSVGDWIPVKRRATLDPKKAQEIAESILQVGLQSPILVRQDDERFVLVEGLHRLEACKQLGEETIVGYVVQARRH